MAAVILITLAVLGCSGSSGSSAFDSQSDGEIETADVVNAPSDEPGSIDVETPPESIVDADADSITAPVGSDATSADTTETVAAVSTRVLFNITVPAYQSNALQVRLQWGDQDIVARFVVDESWEVVADFPTNTENTLIVTFNDNNGAITLGSVEQTFRTGTNPTESLQIAADQFDTTRWDNDGDGVSNLDELISGSNPLGPNLLEPVQAAFELVPDKTFRFSWEPSTGAQFYRVLENPDGVSGFTNISGDLDATTRQYDHRVALLNRLNARYIVQSCSQLTCADSEEIMTPDTIAQAVGYFKANDAEARDAFGVDVELSADGNTLAVRRFGSGREEEEGSSRSERIYVFSRIDGIWQQQAILDGSEPVSSLGYGEAFSLSANGDLLAVGSPGDLFRFATEEEPNGTIRMVGAVYIYQRESDSWREQARLVPDNPVIGQDFGTALSLSSDGNTVAIASNVAVHIFEQTAGIWQERNRIFSGVTEISLSADGRTLAIGSDSVPGIRNDREIFRAGEVRIFTRNDTEWTEQARVIPNDPVEGGNFGRSVSLDADGDVLAVGAPLWNFEGFETRPPIGAAYVFRNTAGEWNQEARLNTTFQGDFTGSEVELNGEGSTLAVITEGFGGFVTIYTNEGASWSQQARFHGSITQTESDVPPEIVSSGRLSDSSPVSFASSLSLSSDGETLAIGAADDNSAAREINGDRNDTSLSSSGAVFLF